MSYRPEYINYLLKELNSLVTNHSSPVISSFEGLGSGSKNFHGQKRLFVPLEEGVFQQDS